MANPIADTYNTGDFINTPLSTLVRDYILALKDGHNRAYNAIVSLEGADNALGVRVTALEGSISDGTKADESLQVGFDVAQANHGILDFEPVHFNGSSFVKAGSGVPALGIARVTDLNNFKLILAGLEIMPADIVDDTGEAYEQGDFYFLSNTVNGSYQKEKPLAGVFQSIFQCIIYDDVKYALIQVGNPVKLAPPVKFNYKTDLMATVLWSGYAFASEGGNSVTHEDVSQYDLLAFVMSHYRKEIILIPTSEWIYRSEGATITNRGGEDGDRDADTYCRRINNETTRVYGGGKEQRGGLHRIIGYKFKTYVEYE